MVGRRGAAYSYYYYYHHYVLLLLLLLLLLDDNDDRGPVLMLFLLRLLVRLSFHIEHACSYCESIGSRGSRQEPSFMFLDRVFAAWLPGFEVRLHTDQVQLKMLSPAADPMASILCVPKATLRRHRAYVQAVFRSSGHIRGMQSHGLQL